MLGIVLSRSLQRKLPWMEAVFEHDHLFRINGLKKCLGKQKVWIWMQGRGIAAVESLIQSWLIILSKRWISSNGLSVLNHTVSFCNKHK